MTKDTIFSEQYHYRVYFQIFKYTKLEEITRTNALLLKESSLEVTDFAQA